MKIVGCDLHTRYQQIAMLDTETGEVIERRLEHANGEARAFYAGLQGPVRVGIEATGHTRWFERLLAELGHELWIGDAAQIRAAMVRKQKTDARDAALRAHGQRLAIGTRIFPRPIGLQCHEVKLFPAHRARSSDEIHAVWYLYLAVLCVQVRSFPF